MKGVLTLIYDVLLDSLAILISLSQEPMVTLGASIHLMCN